ncbi:TIGR00366 family protein [Nesterenkonia alkaliphila]|nr:TIGR00366 family protein [Nesterenkonia alkaliphila]
MMGGIVMGKELLAQARRKNIKIHAPVLVATIFMAFLPSSGGISGAAVLYSATPGYLRDLVPETYEDATPYALPLTNTVLRVDYMLLLAICMLLVVVLAIAMHPKNPEKMKQIEDQLLDEIDAGRRSVKVQRETPAQRANASRLIMYLFGTVGLLYSLYMLGSQGVEALDLNSFNFLFLSLGILLCANYGPEYYAGLIKDGISGTFGFILQFPFYAGIFGLISATGFGELISQAFTTISTAETWPVIAFLYSGLLNIAVPSGGSKFVIEAPYIIPTTTDLGADMGLILQAYQLGDGLTNLLIPFFALPYLANFRLKFSEVVGYTVPVVGLLLLVICGYLFGMSVLL